MVLSAQPMIHPIMPSNRIVRFSLCLTIYLGLTAMSATSWAQQVNLEEIQIESTSSKLGKDAIKRNRSALIPTDKALDMIQGINLIKRGNYAWEPTIRGLHAGQIQLTIDGMHIFGACTDKMDPISAYIEPNNLESIQINKGADMGWNGTGFGGAGIDFRLRKIPFTSALPQTNGLLSTSYHSNGDQWQQAGSFSHATNKWTVQANAVYRRSANYKSGGQREILYSQYEKVNVNVGSSFKVSPEKVIELNYLGDLGNDIGYPALPMDVSAATASIASVTLLDKKSRHFFKSDHWRQDNLTAKFYFNRVEHEMDDSKRPPEMVPIPMDMPGTSWTIGGFAETKLVHDRAKMKHSSLSAWAWDIRLNHYYHQLRATMTMYPSTGNSMFMYTIPDASRWHSNLDLRTSVNWNANLRTTLQGSMGVTHSNLFSTAGKQQLSGLLLGDSPGRTHLPISLGVNTYLQPFAAWSFALKANISSRSPSLQELYGFYLYNQADAYDYLGSHSLNAEKSMIVEGSSEARYNWGTLGLSMYANRLVDYIVGIKAGEISVMTPTAKGVKQYASFGTAEIYGVEFNGNIKLNEQLIFSHECTYMLGRDKDKLALPQISPLRTLSELAWRNGNLSIQAMHEFHGRQDRVNFERYGETNSPSSTLFHVQARFDFRLYAYMASLSAQLDNIFDREYYHHLDLSKIARPGRSMGLQLTVRR